MQYLIFSDSKILVIRTNDIYILPTAKTLEPIAKYIKEQYRTDKNIVASVADLHKIKIDEFALLPIRQALNHFEWDVSNLIAYHQQLLTYYLTHKYCGSCGTKTIMQQKNKFVFCNSCQCEIYPHIAPCIIVRIKRDDKILMARGVNFPIGAWGLIAGFVEIGETLEQAVEREVMEEVGISINNIKYWGSQQWPFPSGSIMVGFTADYSSGELKLDPVEIEAAGFFDRNNIPGKPSTNFSIASKMINQFIDAG